jgi:hypothetical protein
VADGAHAFKYATENVPGSGRINGSVRWMLSNTTEQMNHPTVQTHPTQIVGKREILAALYPQLNPASQHDYHQRQSDEQCLYCLSDG